MPKEMKRKTRYCHHHCLIYYETERHWMEMWKESKNELKQLREDEDVRVEILTDIEAVKRRKGEEDWFHFIKYL